MSKRINIVLPDTTVKVLDRVAPKGDRSRFISEAVLHYVETVGKKSLKEQLKAGYQANAARNLEITTEWFPLEEETGARAKGSPSAPRRDLSGRLRSDRRPGDQKDEACAHHSE